MLIGFFPSAAQSPLDAYKYIIVPKKFDFLQEENQYRVNSTTKHLFEKNGFSTLIKGGEYPEDLKQDPCLGATAEIVDESTLLMTKLYVVLLDCQDQEVYRSEMGKSGEKAWDKTYIYALNDAFTSFEEMDYSFDPSLTKGRVATSTEPAANAPAQVAAPAEVVVITAATTPTTSPANTPNVTTPAVGAAVAATTGAEVATADQEKPAKEAVPQVQEEAQVQEETRVSEESEVSVANSYGNQNVSFLLIEQGDKLVAYVSDNKNSSYKKGEVIGTLVRTSLPNVFRASWKNMDKDIDQTTAYFDDQGNLKIDVERGGQIEVLTFVKE